MTKKVLWIKTRYKQFIFLKHSNYFLKLVYWPLNKPHVSQKQLFSLIMIVHRRKLLKFLLNQL